MSKVLDAYKDYLREFYSRPDVVFETIGALAVAMLAYADKLPFWLVLVLLVIRQAGGVKGMKKANDA